MILSYKELRKRDVVNIADGRSFGKITDLKLEFPRGILKGIVVNEGRKSGFFGLFCKNEIFIDEKNIIRIGGDVILVNLKNCAAITPTSVEVNGNSNNENSSVARKSTPCPPPLPVCPPVCPPPDPCGKKNSADFCIDGEINDFEDF